MKNFVVVVLALLVAAYAAQAKAGQPVSFQTGKTTMQEVVQALGESNSSTIDRGTRNLCYRYAGRPTVPESFIRIVGSASQEADLTCCFSFTPDGVLAETASKVEQIDTALMAAAKADAQAGRQISCPPLMLRPDATIHLPFASTH